jgi:hypothetical protein
VACCWPTNPANSDSAIGAGAISPAALGDGGLQGCTHLLGWLRSIQPLPAGLSRQRHKPSADARQKRFAAGFDAISGAMTAPPQRLRQWHIEQQGEIRL